MIAIPIIMSITSGASLLLGFLLLHLPKKNIVANRWLGLFIITLGLAMMEIFLVSQHFQANHPVYFEMIGISRFLTAPVLYLAVVSFTSPKKSFKAVSLWHFVAFVLVLLFRIPFFISGQNFNLHPPMREILFFTLQMILPIQTVTYWVLSFLRLRQHQKNINQFSAAHEKIDLLWLQSFLLILLLVMIVWFNLVFFNIKPLAAFTPLFYLIGIFFLAHFSLKQREVFDFSASDLHSISEIIEVRKETKKKRLTPQQLTFLNEKLEHAMQIEKVFLNNDLSLPALSKKLGASANDTSYLINEIHQDNFYNFINRHRIEEAKNLLLTDQYQKLSIIGIAYECGFNSKTVFNAAFKKYTGQSPTQYIKLSRMQKNQ